MLVNNWHCLPYIVEYFGISNIVYIHTNLGTKCCGQGKFITHVMMYDLVRIDITYS